MRGAAHASVAKRDDGARGLSGGAFGPTTARQLIEPGQLPGCARTSSGVYYSPSREACLPRSAGRWTAEGLSSLCSAERGSHDRKGATRHRLRKRTEIGRFSVEQRREFVGREEAVALRGHECVVPAAELGERDCNPE